MSPTFNNRSAGFTLIELMIAMAIAGIVSAAMYATFQAQVRGQVSQDVSLAMTQSLRAAMEIMATDIRMAGCDPTQGAGAGIVTAAADNLISTMDIGGGASGQPNGSIEPNELVEYGIDLSDNLGRGVNTGALEPLHSTGMQCDALDFVYLALDNTNTPADADRLPDVLNDPATGVVDAADLDDIIAIQVSVVVRSADTANPGFLRATTDNTVYRNLQGTPIFTPTAANNMLRRFQLSETIDCRNL